MEDLCKTVREKLAVVLFVTQAGRRRAQPALVKGLLTAMTEDVQELGIWPIAQEFHPANSAKLAELKQAKRELAAAELGARQEVTISLDSREPVRGDDDDG